jgi:Cu-Zn family superoxide dismutase
MERQEVSPLRIAFLVASLLALSLSWTFGCKRSMDDEVKEAMSRRQKADATARLAGRAGSSAHGFVRFIQDDDGVRLIGEFAGLPPGQHGFHVHEKGDCSAPDFTSAGEHFATEGHRTHGLPNAPQRHTGDLGNVVANGHGTASIERKDSVIALDGERSIIGRAVVVHERGDDGRDPKSAGGRILCGVIEQVDLRERTSHRVERSIPDATGTRPGAEPRMDEPAHAGDHTIPPLTPPPPVVP